MYPPLKSLHFRGSRKLTSPRHSESESIDGISDVSETLNKIKIQKQYLSKKGGKLITKIFTLGEYE